VPHNDFVVNEELHVGLWPNKVKIKLTVTTVQ
jgi:hypothetical protein